MREVVPVDETHRRLFKLLFQHGTPEEILAAKETLTLMRDLRAQHPEGSWEPMETVQIPAVVAARARRVAAQRNRLARKFPLGEVGGARRTLEEEERTVLGQYAACLALGFQFGDRLTHKSAKANGNLGNGCSAFVPKLGNFSLLLGPEERRNRYFFLMHQDDELVFRCAGWCRAGEFMLPEYERPFLRNGVTRVVYVVPNELLHPLRTWWE